MEPEVWVAVPRLRLVEVRSEVAFEVCPASLEERWDEIPHCGPHVCRLLACREFRLALQKGFQVVQMVALSGLLCDLAQSI